MFPSVVTVGAIQAGPVASIAAAVSAGASVASIAGLLATQPVLVGAIASGPIASILNAWDTGAPTDGATGTRGEALISARQALCGAASAPAVLGSVAQPLVIYNLNGSPRMTFNVLTAAGVSTRTPV
jgi:hypothetical protein